MNVLLVCMVAIMMHFAQILMAITSVHVNELLLAREEIAQVSNHSLIENFTKVFICDEQMTKPFV